MNVSMGHWYSSVRNTRAKSNACHSASYQAACTLSPTETRRLTFQRDVMHTPGWVHPTTSREPSPPPSHTSPSSRHATPAPHPAKNMPRLTPQRALHGQAAPSSQVHALRHAVHGGGVLVGVALVLRELHARVGVGVAAVLCRLALPPACEVQDALQLLVVEEVVEAPHVALLTCSTQGLEFGRALCMHATAGGKVLGWRGVDEVRAGRRHTARSQTLKACYSGGNLWHRDMVPHPWGGWVALCA